MENQAPVIVATVWKQTEASVIKSLLESYSIPCHFSSELPHGIYPLSMDGLAEIRIFVPAALADEARRILHEHRRTHHAHLRLVDDDDELQRKIR
jgi:hypothetical protein